ncbi:MAG: flagellar filament capping protein FliD [Candidatus Rokubacteria bacterium]|nr:flagellar filament capping protein FliD [Candidatus Rokubacteria bacterium]
MADITAIGTLATPAQLAELARRLLARDRVPLQALQDRQSLLNKRSSVLGTLRGKLSLLKGALDQFLQPGTLSPFAAKSATSSDTALLGAAASTSASAGSHTVVVNQLAKRSTFASAVYTDSGTAISGAGTGTFNFTLTINGTAYTASVTVNAGDTDRTVLSNVATAITNAVSGKATAVVVATESGKSRLSLASTETGTANNIAFTDTDGLLGRLGLTNATAATDTDGGYIYKDLGNHELDAKVTLNGLTYYRESNTISDLIAGLTFTLKAADASKTVTVNVEPDADGILAKIKDFITKYNDVLDFLAANSAVDTKAGTRGVLSLDPVVSGFRSQLRSLAATVVGSAASGDPNSLPALGILAGADGKLSISNETTLKDTIKSDPTAVSTVFAATSDGVATKIEDFIDDYTGAGGRISATQTQLSTRIRGLDTQIARMKAALEKKQLALQQQLARDQSVLVALNRQLAQVQKFFTTLSGTTT